MMGFCLGDSYLQSDNIRLIGVIDRLYQKYRDDRRDHSVYTLKS